MRAVYSKWIVGKIQGAVLGAVGFTAASLLASAAAPVLAEPIRWSTPAQGLSLLEGARLSGGFTFDFATREISDVALQLQQANGTTTIFSAPVSGTASSIAVTTQTPIVNGQPTLLLYFALPGLGPTGGVAAFDRNPLAISVGQCLGFVCAPLGLRGLSPNDVLQRPDFVLTGAPIVRDFSVFEFGPGTRSVPLR